MGQQQLLLIGLGVIIVGVAIIVGINLFSATAVQSNRDALITDMAAIASMAQEFYRKPKALASGGYRFTGFTIPRPMRSNANGTFTASIAAQKVTLTGRGKEKGNNKTAVVRVTMVADPYRIVSVKINN
ncbi:MAG: hypothetical protein A3J84_07465 [Ignavibacteria bacterium RIFOXYA2_FULL_37_17]|nr:MAG: hypothetical protein A3J84_07465 [Ignavibacteria bacterium RIFOXYA2_FULL_37_17]